MNEFKKLFSHHDSASAKYWKKDINTKKRNRSNIHKCPVNTLLTSIFSGIAWNG